MPFAPLPVLAAMREVYALSLSLARFRAYLRLLQGSSKGDMVLPVQHFNPMAKEALVARLDELQQLGAERLLAEALGPLNATTPAGEPLVRVALNLADDAHGGWTNRCTTDFANNFRLGAPLRRGFCTPLVWSSEPFSAGLIRQRTLAQAWRCRYRLTQPAPRTLAAHLAQETYVARQLGTLPGGPVSPPNPTALGACQRHQAATDEATLLAFFYGDEAARTLGLPPLGGLGPAAGYELARALAAKTSRPA